jgi:hypothetical protein
VTVNAPDGQSCFALALSRLPDPGSGTPTTFFIAELTN